jgi:hypothetical protein
MDKRLLESSNGRNVWMEEKDDKLVIHSESDVSASLEYAKQRRSEVHQKSYKSALRKKNMVLVGSWPNEIVLKLKAETGLDLFSPDPDMFEAACKRLESDYSAFKYIPGKYF